MTSAERGQVSRVSTAETIFKYETQSHSQQFQFQNIFIPMVQQKCLSERLKTHQLFKICYRYLIEMALRVVNNNALSLKAAASKVITHFDFCGHLKAYFLAVLRLVEWKWNCKNGRKHDNFLNQISIPFSVDAGLCFYRTQVLSQSIIYETDITLGPNHKNIF